MELKQARVRNFRSIKDTNWVDIHEDITTLLGANESGKTSFLEAIAHFDNKDKYDNSDIRETDASLNHLPTPILDLELSLSEREQSRFRANSTPRYEGEVIYLRKYSDGSRRILSEKNSQTPASGIFNSDYIINLSESLKDLLNEIAEGADDDIKESISESQGSIQQLINTDEEITAERLEEIYIPLENRHLALLFTSKSEEIQRAIKELQAEASQISEQSTPAEEILSYTPTFLYHDSATLLSDEVKINDVDTDEHRTFRSLLEICNIEYDEFKDKSKRERSIATEQVETTIEGRVNELWEQKSVDVTVDYDSGEFIVSIKDIEVDGEDGINRSLVPPSQRSRGFQWFFSFYINLQASANKEYKNTVLLLDDPAIFLHPEGKRNWLDAVEEIAEQNQIIFTSHSPFLIRKEYPSRIRIVEDREGKGTVITDNLLESNEMSLEPLRKALGIGLGDSPFVAKRKILVEGPSDYYILTGIANFFKDYLGSDIISWDEVTIFPVGGADSMVQASKWVMSEEFSYAVLLDNDQKGNDVIDRLQDEAPTVDQERVFQLERNDDYQNFHIEIEDMFRTEFYVDCVNSAYEAKLGEFEPIEVEKSQEEVYIENEEYKQRKIVSKLNDVLGDRGHGKLDKNLVAREIQDRLTGGNADEKDVKQFYEVMEKLRRTMPR